MRQRAMIAMAIANDPDVLIMPTSRPPCSTSPSRPRCSRCSSASDRDQVRHPPDHPRPRRGGGRGRPDLVMYAGRPVELARSTTSTTDPRHPYTLGLLAALPRMDCREAAADADRGSPPSLAPSSPPAARSARAARSPSSRAVCPPVRAPSSSPGSPAGPRRLPFHRGDWPASRPTPCGASSSRERRRGERGQRATVLEVPRAWLRALPGRRRLHARPGRYGPRGRRDELHRRSRRDPRARRRVRLRQVHHRCWVLRPASRPPPVRCQFLGRDVASLTAARTAPAAPATCRSSFRTRMPLSTPV